MRELHSTRRRGAATGSGLIPLIPSEKKKCSKTNFSSTIHILTWTSPWCFPAQADGHVVVRHRARPAGGLHPPGGEGLGAELAQALQGAHLQQA